MSADNQVDLVDLLEAKAEQLRAAHDQAALAMARSVRFQRENEVLRKQLAEAQAEIERRNRRSGKKKEA